MAAVALALIVIALLNALDGWPSSEEAGAHQVTTQSISLPPPPPVDPKYIDTLLPPDSTRAIDAPQFETVEAAAADVDPDERVIGLVINGDARACPIPIMSTHEIVNDEEPVRDVLARHGLSFCIFESPGMRCPRWVTGPIVYVRFHGSSSLYAGRYSREELAGWAEMMRSFLSAGHDVYVYFNNDAFGHAVINAHELQEMMNRER